MAAVTCPVSIAIWFVEGELQPFAMRCGRLAMQLCVCYASLAVSDVIPCMIVRESERAEIYSFGLEGGGDCAMIFEFWHALGVYPRIRRQQCIEKWRDISIKKEQAIILQAEFFTGYAYILKRCNQEERGTERIVQTTDGMNNAVRGERAWREEYWNTKRPSERTNKTKED